jgi:hypothetical protein
MYAQLVGFRTGQNLVDGEQSPEMFGGDPAFLRDELISDHVNLGDGSAPGEESEP